jgi:hypothetical protein
MKNDIYYDIIADIHGRFDKLSALMERLGYEKNGEGFIPPVGHKALFLGDLIDPKPGHEYAGGVRATLRAVKAMCDRGDALCIMGNHELNAIYFHSKGPEGKWLRIRGAGNRKMHQSTLDDFPDYDDPQSDWQRVWIPWMKQLPFFLELDGLRAVHACWHPEMIGRINGRSFDDHEFFLACADKKKPEGEAMETLLKGLEVPLPTPHYFIDHAGNIRKHFRARWWEMPGDEVLCSELVFPASDKICQLPVAAEARSMFQPYQEDACPVFMGHYFKPAHSPLEPELHNVACLDHAAATSGPLVAYRWKGESSINPEHYIVSHEA